MAMNQCRDSKVPSSITPRANLIRTGMRPRAILTLLGFAVLASGYSTAVTHRGRTRSNSVFYWHADKDKGLAKHDGFQFEIAHPWAFTSSGFEKLENPRSMSGVQIDIRGYEWTPILDFYALPKSVRWQDDLPKMVERMTTAFGLHDIKVSEELTSYNKFTGHGTRKVGTNHENHRYEYILFYPEGEMAGTRIVVILCGSPNVASRREMDAILGSVSYHPVLTQ